MILRKMIESDIPFIAEMYSKLGYFIKKETNDVYFDFPELNANITSGYLTSIMNDRNKIVIIAEINNSIIGFISGEITDCFLPISSVKEIGYISGAYVEAGYRRKGALNALVSEIEKFFKRKGVKYTELNVLTNNISAKTVWNKIGYKTFREQMRKQI